MKLKNNLPEEGLDNKISLGELAQTLRKYIFNLTDADEIKELLGLNRKSDNETAEKLKQLFSENPKEKGDA